VGWTWGAAAQIEQDRAGDIAFGQPEFGGLGPVDREFESRQIRRLLNSHIDRTAQVAKLVRDHGGDPMVSGQIAAQHLDVKRSGQAKLIVWLTISGEGNKR